MPNVPALDEAANRAPAPSTAPHPEEMRASFEMRAGKLWVHAAARMTPAGLAALGFAAAAVLVGAASLVSAAVQRRRT